MRLILGPPTADTLPLCKPVKHRHITPLSKNLINQLISIKWKITEKGIGGAGTWCGRPAHRPPPPRVVSCPAPTCQQPRPRAGSRSAAAWLRRAGRLPPRAPALLPRHRPRAQRGSNGQSGRAGSAQPPARAPVEEAEEQVKEMINFLFLLKLGNRISGAAGQASRESSWQAGNPGERGPHGRHRWTLGAFWGCMASPDAGWDPQAGQRDAA